MSLLSVHSEPHAQALLHLSIKKTPTYYLKENRLLSSPLLTLCFNDFLLLFELLILLWDGFCLILGRHFTGFKNNRQKVFWVKQNNFLINFAQSLFKSFAFRKNDFSDSVFVALSGRLRSVSDKIVIEEFGRGDVLGIVEVLQQNPRTTTGL